MVSRQEIVTYLDEILDIPGWEPVDSSRNGLQVIGRDEGTLILGATDASQALFEIAKESDAFLVFVHHGLFWADIQRVDGVVKTRLAALFQSNTNLYAAHLPLDAHPELGNNAQLLRLLTVENTNPWGTYHERKIGCKGTLPEPELFTAFAQRVQDLLAVPPLTVMANGPEMCHSIGVISGGATANFVAEATSAGLDTLLVGEAGHSFFHLSKEYGLNVIGGGHYATETWGVKAVLERLQAQYPEIQAEFIDLPTGL